MERRVDPALELRQIHAEFFVKKLQARRVDALHLRLEVVDEVEGLAQAQAVVGHLHNDNWVAYLGGLEEFEEAPGTREHAPRQEKHERVALVHALRDEVAQVLEHRGVEKHGCLQHLSEHVVHVARVGGRLHLIVREKARVDVSRPPVHVWRIHRAHRPFCLQPLVDEVSVRVADEGKHEERKHRERDQNHDNDNLLRRLEA
mmetsp:Transcript_20538/g.51333  ORF Transcript_20538/g.51333 Transcript_20538/m.51333 type:complete len:202 (+) Transcript_20538:1383-1988(+)